MLFQGEGIRDESYLKANNICKDLTFQKYKFIELMKNVANARFRVFYIGISSNYGDM